VKAPLPLLTPDNREYWTAGEYGRLMINRCGSCERWSHPPVPICRWCHSFDIEPQQSCGTGLVLSYTVNRKQWTQRPIAPYVIAVVGLDDEPRPAGHHAVGRRRPGGGYRRDTGRGVL
jgi:uncharacterized OB-fold protein